MKAEAMALKEARRGANSTEEQRRNSPTDCQKYETQRPQDISTFSDESPQNANHALLYFLGFVEFQDMKCNQVEMLSASKQIKLHYS